jgi:FkbM family methyltransferase
MSYTFTVKSLKKSALEILALLEPSPTPLTLATRFGSTNDGGYVLINDFSKNDFLISMGVADDVSFEKEISKYLKEIHLYDDSINSLPESLLNGTFFRERVGGVGCVSISDAVKRAKNPRDFILKMDIEGSEWAALEAESSETLELFRQIIVEFHWVNGFNGSEYFSQSLSVLNKLNQTHFILNAHPNNCGELIYVDGVMFPEVIEVTYLRRKDYKIVFDHAKYKKDLFKVNSPCNPNLPEIYVHPFSLYIDSNKADSNALISTPKKIQELTRQRDDLINSTIWKMTKPLRTLINFVKK